MPNAPKLHSRLGSSLTELTKAATRASFIHDEASNTRMLMAKNNATFDVPMSYMLEINRRLQAWRFVSAQPDEKGIIKKEFEDGATSAYTATMIGNARINKWQSNPTTEDHK